MNDASEPGMRSKLRPRRQRTISLSGEWDDDGLEELAHLIHHLKEKDINERLDYDEGGKKLVIHSNDS